MQAANSVVWLLKPNDGVLMNQLTRFPGTGYMPALLRVMIIDGMMNRGRRGAVEAELILQFVITV